MKKTFYIACWRPEGGIYAFDFNFDTRKIESVRLAAPGSHTAYFDQRDDILYVLSEIGETGREGAIESFRMKDGALTKIDEVRGILSGAPHIRLGQDGRTMYVASYSTGEVSSVDVKDGIFGPVTGVIPHSGGSAHPIRQAAPHAHMMCQTPDGGYVVCVDLGTDQLRVYRILEDGTMSLSGTVAVPAGYGSRHMVFSKDGRYAYVVCELQYHLVTYRYLGDGRFEMVRDLKVLEDLPEDQNWGGAIRLSEDGKWLYTTNRGTEQSSIDLLSLEDPEAPALVASMTDCAHPRDFMVLTVDGDTYLFCLNMTADSTAVYLWDEEKKGWDLLDKTEETPMPVCIATEKDAC